MTTRAAKSAAILAILWVTGLVSAAHSPLKSNSADQAPTRLGPVSFELIDNRIFVSVTINGQGPFHLILDTGANLSLSPEATRRAGLRTTGSGESGGVGEKTVAVQYARISKLDFGPVHLSGLDCTVLSTSDSPYVFGRVAVDGYFGLEVFQKYVVRHDYQKKELTFYDPRAFTYSGPGEAVPFQRDGNIPVITAEFDGIRGRFGVDTGARTALILYGPFVAENKIAEKYNAKFQGVSGWGIGGPLRSWMVRSRSLKIGGVEMRDLVARLSLNKSGATARSGRAGLIGPDVLKQFVFICDYERNRLIFEKNSDFGLRDGYDRSGMWISQKDDAFEVFDVIPGGPAEHAGLKPGDRILSVNGSRTTQLILTDVRDSWKYGAAGSTVRLEVVSNTGTKREVRLVLADLV